MAAFTRLLHAVTMVTAFASADGFAVSYSDPEVLREAEYAISSYNHIQDYSYAFKLISVQSAITQIYPPAKVKYTMTVTVGQTVCKNTPNIDPFQCGLQKSPDAKTMRCSFVVLGVPHADVPKHLLEGHCQ
ncbi:hypothetical protein AGOR_G00100760 [Albula goreensis]|uniref:Cystatin domain-containing protein n=1 Tax=Albula goreensis TaxID=1534307 RepID=A0A8T3DLU4_9TELE|nr:hypothetical protein AGOR_G00100760 [Albula goreensis]